MKNFATATRLLALLLSVVVTLPATAASGQTISTSAERRNETTSNQRKAQTPMAGGQRTKKKRESSSEKLFREARKAFQKGHYRDAATMYMVLIERDGTDLEARQNAAYAYFKDQDFQHCYDQANEVLRRNPNSAHAYALAAAALLRSGYIQEALYALTQAFKLDTKDPLAFGTAAEIDYYEGRTKDAISKAFRAHDLDPDEADFLMTIARASSRVELYEQAAEAYERFLAIAPETDKERRERIAGLVQFYRQLAGLQVHEVSGPKFSQVAFQLGSDRRPYLRVKLNGRDAIFVIDTGSGFTVLSKEAAKKFKVSDIARGGHSQGVGGTGKFPIVYGLIKTLELGDIKVKSVPCFIRPFHIDKDAPPDFQADGFIGLSVLSHFLTEIDYQANVIRLDQEANRTLPVVTQAGITVVPFRTTQNGLISVETELDGKNRINAILDSGASSTVISSAAVERLSMREQIIKGQTTKVIGAGGISDNVELLQLHNCRVADLRQENLRALVLDFGAINETAGFEQSGILGGDFLRHFSVTINFTRAEVTLRPYTSSIKRITPAEKVQNSE
ncbi:MAG: aspartyl protease family protein [Acidobacteria bacterium]|nr:aspartyl protease family protein [Acidobacteriota bacterium]